MTGIHIHTDGLDHFESAVIELVLLETDGVSRVASLVNAGVTSVLYDESRTDAGRLVAAIRSAGFSAEIWRPSAIRAMPPSHGGH